MKLISKISEYAVRSLLILGRYPNNRLLVSEICQKQQIPEHFTRKALQVLMKHNYVIGSRGPGGGYQLNKTARSIKIVDIIKLYEGPQTLKYCPLGKMHCTVKKPCPFRKLQNLISDEWQQNIQDLNLETLISNTREQTTKIELPL